MYKYVVTCINMYSYTTNTQNQLGCVALNIKYEEFYKKQHKPLFFISLFEKYGLSCFEQFENTMCFRVLGVFWNIY